MGVVKKSKFDGILEDTLNIYLDRYPFDHDESSMYVELLGGSDNPLLPYYEFILFENGKGCTFFNSHDEIEIIS